MKARAWRKKSSFFSFFNIVSSVQEIFVSFHVGIIIQTVKGVLRTVETILTAVCFFRLIKPHHKLIPPADKAGRKTFICYHPLHLLYIHPAFFSGVSMLSRESCSIKDICPLSAGSFFSGFFSAGFLAGDFFALVFFPFEPAVVLPI